MYYIYQLHLAFGDLSIQIVIRGNGKEEDWRVPGIETSLIDAFLFLN